MGGLFIISLLLIAHKSLLLNATRHLSMFGLTLGGALWHWMRLRMSTTQRLLFRTLFLSTPRRRLGRPLLTVLIARPLALIVFGLAASLIPQAFGQAFNYGPLGSPILN